MPDKCQSEVTLARVNRCESRLVQNAKAQGAPLGNRTNLAEAWAKGAAAEAAEPSRQTCCQSSGKYRLPA
jgi:hypothetical protein